MKAAAFASLSQVPLSHIGLQAEDERTSSSAGRASATCTRGPRGLATVGVADRECSRGSQLHPAIVEQRMYCGPVALPCPDPATADRHATHPPSPALTLNTGGSARSAWYLRIVDGWMGLPCCN